MQGSTVLSKTERRARILLALDDGEYRLSGIAAFTELSDQQTRADLGWLERNGFAQHTDLDDGRSWQATSKGCEYLAGLSDEEKDW
jgi:hypothetical protein